MRKAIFKSIDHEGITAEMICIEQLQKRLMKALERADIDTALAAHKDIAKSLKQIQQYEKQSTVKLLKAAAKIKPVTYPKSLKNKMKGLI
ncbi:MULTISPECIES: hypothetical protein [Bacillus]|uniref:hypothetical protein n=1 Tax=Bacillus TaxID=1386 RepID=UPI001CCE0596|nr:MULTISPECIES: hypothetical protein [Bacillus]MCA0163295.1 hypothetical protein [Bacillus sp. RAR_M1_44]MCA0923113.1 hypothetical protein [Bacillus stratosphericus]WOI40433.1 hypothetical protein RZ534_14840 [Bacillus altitudinis]